MNKSKKIELIEQNGIHYAIEKWYGGSPVERWFPIPNGDFKTWIKNPNFEFVIEVSLKGVAKYKTPLGTAFTLEDFEREWKLSSFE